VVGVASKNITLRVDEQTYERYRKFCKQHGLLVSRKFEITMEEQMKGWKLGDQKE
jgi:hypothetical protein